MWFSDGGGKKTVPAKGSVAATPKLVSTPLPATKSPVKGKTTLPPLKRPVNDSTKPVEVLKSNLKVTIMDRDDMDIPPGQVRRSIGDVFMWDHCEYVVQRVSPTSATAVCMNRNRQTVTNKLTGETATFEKSAREIRISSCCDRQDIIRREENFQPQKPGAVGPTNKQSGTKENSMAKIKAPKTTQGTVLDMIVKMAKAGKSEKDITSAVKSNYGGPTPSVAYLIGREWRRVNKVGRHFAVKGKAVKSAPKAPAKKAPPVKQVAAKKPAPKAKVVKTTPPPPRAVESEPTPEQESAPE